MKLFTKVILFQLFPLLTADSLIDLASAGKSFDEYKTTKSRIGRIIVVAIFSFIILTAFRPPFLLFLQIQRSPDEDPLRYQTVICATFAVIEMLSIRIWLFLIIREARSIENIHFLQFLTQLNQESEKTILLWTKIVSTQLNSSALIIGALFFWVEISITHNNWYIFVSLIHMFMILYALRISPNDILIPYVYAFSICKVVLDQMDHLTQLVAQFDHFAQPMFAVLTQYSLLTESIRHLNSLCGYLMLSSKIFVIPFGSLVFVVAATPTEGSSMFIFKIIILTGLVVYPLHGYLLTAALSQVDTVSKRFYSQTHSVIVRRKGHNLSDVLRLKLILEDLSSSSSRLAVREFSGKVTQMDTFDSVILTLSLLTLLFALRMSGF